MNGVSFEAGVVPELARARDVRRGAFHRAVKRIVNAPVRPGVAAGHQARLLIPPGDWAAIDPFLVLTEDWYPMGVFDSHPHRGFEVVTFVLEGCIEHQDNHGNRGRVPAGDAQWLTAGGGVIHSETPADGKAVHALQLWVNLPAAEKMIEPQWQGLAMQAMPLRREPGVEVRVFSGRSNHAKAATYNHTPVNLLSIKIQPGASLCESLPSDYNGFVLVLRGAVVVGHGSSKEAVAAGQLAWLTRDATSASSDVHLTALEDPLELLLVAGRPLDEPVAARGSFVMNTSEQIAQAYSDYREGRFGV